MRRSPHRKELVMLKDMLFLSLGAGFAGVFGFLTASPLYGLAIFMAMLVLRHVAEPAKY